MRHEDILPRRAAHPFREFLLDFSVDSGSGSVRSQWQWSKAAAGIRINDSVSGGLQAQSG
jgi:hypothetical protein